MIDKQNLLDDLIYCKELGRKSLEAVIKVINNQPEVESNRSRREWYQIGYQDGLKADKWISIEDDLPKTNGVYQTVRKVMEGNMVYYLEGASYFDGQNTWHNDIGVNHGREYPNVVAWQPIQEYINH